jgi:PPOX class probable F420-dependent enzyme
VTNTSAVELPSELRELADNRAFAALTTMLPDGQPQTHVMWFDVDDDSVLINTEVGRQKHKNMTRNKAVTVTVMDPQNPYRFIEVRGQVVGEIRGPEARAHIDACSERYTGAFYPQERIGTERVIMRIAPTRIYTQG